MTDAKPLPGLEERHAEVKGVRMRYFTGGTGEPLILVHGLGGAASNWRELAALLLPHRRLLIPDLPGHGGSSPLPAVPGLEPYADRVALVAAWERMLPAAVAGHSLGGVVALRMAIGRPNDVGALVLAGAAGLSVGSAWTRAMLAVYSYLRPGRLVARRHRIVARSPLLRRLLFAPFSVGDPDMLSEASIEGFFSAQALHTDVAGAHRALGREHPRQELDRVRCPALVLWGSDDRQLPLDDAFEYARRLRASLRVIPGCGHLLIAERPDACADAILSFLANRLD